MAWSLLTETQGPAELLYVGDRLDVDAVGSARAGLHGVWLHRHGPTETVEGVLRVPDLRDLRRVIDLIEGKR
jgi:putative hydrolase of the HAD superfamily